MQLARSKSISIALSAMTVTLLGSGSVRAAEGDQIESSLLIYSETDRVTAVEGLASFSKLIDGRTWRLRLTYDGLTGASPNGATPSSRIQTFTRPSGEGRYNIPAGETPLDDTFHDTRFGVDLSLTQPLDRLSNISLGTHFSNEYDYLSLGGNVGLTRDLNHRNTTVGLSVSYSRDKIRPDGGIPVRFAETPTTRGALPRAGGSDTKDVFDAIFSVSQVVDRKTLARFNYSFGSVAGYQTDPFKILSVVEPASSADAGEPVRYVYESRPDSRAKHALYGEVRRYFSGNVANLSYRYFWDDWGVRSHTVNAGYLQMLGNDYSVEPHLRWYRQTQADFYHAFLVDGNPLPRHASADYRLADFDAWTVGLTVGKRVGDNIRLRLTGEYYSQFGDRSPPEAIGVLRDFDLFPNVGVFMLRLGFSREL
jgi:hypothetical protein